MALSYLSGGEQPTAALMNALWTELDRKLNLVLSGKSPFAFKNVHPLKFANIENALGKRFYFVGAGSTPFINGIAGASNYDHSIYTSAIATGSVTETDDDSGLALMTLGSVVDLDNSLEAHQVEDGGEQYYIRTATSTRATRISRYGAAEFICEGQSSIDVPDNYNRYNYIRIHNLNLHTLTVTFNTAGPQAYQIEPLGIVTIKRSAVGGTYENPLTYFWETAPGDPRTYHMRGDHAGNNAVSPAHAFVWLHALTTRTGQSVVGRNEFGWRIDPSETHDLSGYDSYFGNQATGTTKLVDLLKHKGTLYAVERGANPTVTAIEYDGDTNLASRLAAVGVSRNGNQLTPPPGKDMDLVAISTNLFKQGETVSCFVELPYDLEGSLATWDTFPITPTLDDPEEERSYYDLTDTLQTVTQKVDDLVYADTDMPTLGLPESTVADLTGSLTNYTSVEPHLGVNGFYWLGDLELSTTYPGMQDVIDAIDAQNTTEGDLVYEDDKLIYRRRFGMGPQGWPANIEGDGGPPRRWLSPRAGQRFSDLTLRLDVNWSDYMINGFVGPDVVVAPVGGDVSINTAPASPARSCAILGPVSRTTVVENIAWPEHYFLVDPYRVQEFLDNYTAANWYENNRARLISGALTKETHGITAPNGDYQALMWPLQREHYNHLAWRINALKRGHPIQVWDIWLNMAPDTAGLLDGGLTSTVRPKNQFRRVALGDDYYNQATALGISIRNYNQLPTAWLNIRSSNHFATNWFYRLEDSILSGSVAFGGTFWTGTVVHESVYDNIIYGSGQGTYQSGYFDRTFYRPGDLNDDYFWIAIEDVKTFSDSLGLTFSYAVKARPYKLSTSNPAATPTHLFESYSQYNEVSGNYATEAEAQAWVDGKVGTSTTPEFSWFGNRQYVRMMPANLESEIEWIEDTDGLLKDYTGESADALVSKQSNNSNDSYFDQHKPTNVAAVDEGEKQNWCYLVWGTLDLDVHAFLISRHYWVRTPLFSTLSLANAAHVATYGDELGRPAALVPSDTNDNKTEDINASKVLWAHGVPAAYEVAILEDRYVDLS